ncbi:MAG: hypothetical protein CL537_02940 [Alcanivoracaceae bacterium]|nr:hypothetical protein [Alcanivoracaceae bacterium]|tara:strand:- start:2912 stop:3739 length:828 start_codon:yes stop_codon:yes gene_type:complete
METLNTATLLEHIQDNTTRLEFNKTAFAAKLDVAALPQDTMVVGLEEYRPHRNRFRGNFITRSVDDFVNYTSAKADDGAECFVYPEDMSATAVLNLGDLSTPGHADSKAVMKLKSTAAFDALNKIDGRVSDQQQLAEWLEDWRDSITGLTSDEQQLSASKVIAAIRRITIKAGRTSEHTEGQLSASRSSMEQVEASSNSEPLPSFILFTCKPYMGLGERTFALRLTLREKDDQPLLALRIIRPEQHEEEMAEEFAALLQEKFGTDLPVTIGTFAA